MLKAPLLFSILMFSLFALGQSSVKELDKALDSRLKGKLKKIIVGKRSNGFATFYYKSDKAVCSVEKREAYKTGGRTDSASSFSANFRNDTLFRVVIRRAVPLEKQGWVIMYLDEDRVLVQDGEGKVYIPEISKIIEYAHQLREKAKELIESR